MALRGVSWKVAAALRWPRRFKASPLRGILVLFFLWNGAHFVEDKTGTYLKNVWGTYFFHFCKREFEKKRRKSLVPGRRQFDADNLGRTYDMIPRGVAAVLRTVALW